MEFRFNVNEIFKQPIVEINSSLIPPGVSLADKRALWDAVSKVSDVVNTLGEASANAQGLTKPITTSERLRNSEHRLYLLIDQGANNGKGEVTGMLKTGKKGLYVFDRDGHHYQVSPSCVLDFYIHESKQRMGLGKKLFEHMLEKEHVEPVKMAIDRPSDKFLGFLNKHYSLDNPVKQMNNFVVFDGFFPEAKKENVSENNTPLGKSNQPANGLQSSFSSPYGRYGAPRPPCSMGQIIHNQSPLAQQSQEPAGTSLSIRSPTKTRSLYNEKPQQSNSSGNPQISQTVPNIPQLNQNNNTQQFQNPQQMQMSYQTQNITPNIQYQPQQYQNQPQQYHNPSQQYQNPPQYQNSQHTNRYLQSSHPQYQNQPQQTYYQQLSEQNQFNANTLQQQQNLYPSYAVTGNTQPNISQLQERSTPMMQQSVQNDAEMHLQHKKSVQFVPVGNRMPQSNYQPIRTNSSYEQGQTSTLQENQQMSLPNIPFQQVAQPTDNPNIHQNIQNARSVPQVSQTPIQNLPQQIYQHSQTSQLNNQQQQSQVEYQQQLPHHTQSSQPVYQQQINQNQYPQNIQGQVTENQQIQQNPITQDSNAALQNMSPQFQNDIKQVNVTPSAVNQNQQIYSNQNAGPNIYYQNMQQPINPPYSPVNQQLPMTPQSIPNHTMNYQQPPTPATPNTQMQPQMQYSQPHAQSAQVFSPQSQPNIDPTKIIPPAESTNNQTTNSQFYDSNQDKIQNEYVKPGIDTPIPPNASGDMQPLAEQSN